MILRGMVFTANRWAVVIRTAHPSLLGVVARLVAVALVAVLGYGISSPFTAYAEPQSNLSIKNAKVSVWPEYDDPRVLVIVEGEFAGDANFSQQVKFRIPKGAEINQVCALRKPADEHLCQLYEVSQDGEALSYTLPIPTFFLEYYYQPPQGQSDRRLEYSFDSYYPVGKLEVEVQQPLRSSNFDLSPKAAGVLSDKNGFSYYQYRYDNVAPNQPIKLSASYTKSDSRPSVEKQKPGGASASANDFNLPLLGAFGAGLMGLVAFYAIKSRQPGPVPAPAHPAAANAAVRRASPTVPPKPAARTGRASRSVAGTGVLDAPARRFYCTQCGTAIQLDDNFCPKCGQKARKPV